MLNLLGGCIYWAGHIFLVSSIAALITVSILKQPAAKMHQTTAFKTIEPFEVFWQEQGR